MATVKPTVVELPVAGRGGPAYRVTWAAMAGSDVGEAYEIYGYNDRTVQAQGTFDSGTVVLQGTVDGTNYQGLRDPSSTAISFTAAGLKGVLEAVHKVRPSVSGGGGSCAIDLTLLVTRPYK